MPQGGSAEEETMGQQHALQLVHGLGVVEDIFDQPIGFVLNELAAVCEGDHASAVLPTMLQHQQTFVQLSINWPLNEPMNFEQQMHTACRRRKMYEYQCCISKTGKQFAEQDGACKIAKYGRHLHGASCSFALPGVYKCQ